MIGIIDYDLGNRKAIYNMMNRIGIPNLVSRDKNELKKCIGLILPGVGSFDLAKKNLLKFDLNNFIIDFVQEKPLLGICVGMQLLTLGSEEGQESGLGLINGFTCKFQTKSEIPIKIPHVGWNLAKASKNFFAASKGEEKRFYFTHSYYVKCSHPENVAMTTPYGEEFASAVEKKNIFGVQFHPEKSHKYGMDLFRTFYHRCKECIEQESSLRY